MKKRRTRLKESPIIDRSPHAQVPDEALIAQCRAGDKKAWRSRRKISA